MPNSRIEAAFFVDSAILEALGAWTTDGNTLGVGGDNLLGSNDNFEWFFITNGVKRGGYLANGYRFMQTPGTTVGGDDRFRELTWIETTTDASDTVVFSHAISDNTAYRYNGHAQFLDESNAEYGSYSRSIFGRRNTSTTLGKEHAHFSDSTDLDVKSFWRVSANIVEFVIRGLAGTTIEWSGMITFQGIRHVP